MPALRGGVCMNVGGETRVETGPSRQKRGSQVKRNTIKMRSEHQATSNVAVGHECQWCEEVFAELSIRDPWPIRLGAFE